MESPIAESCRAERIGAESKSSRVTWTAGAPGFVDLGYFAVGPNVRISREGVRYDVDGRSYVLKERPSNSTGLVRILCKWLSASGPETEKINEGMATVQSSEARTLALARCKGLASPGGAGSPLTNRASSAPNTRGHGRLDELVAEQYDKKRNDPEIRCAIRMNDGCSRQNAEILGAPHRRAGLLRSPCSTVDRHARPVGVD